VAALPAAEVKDLVLGVEVEDLYEGRDLTPGYVVVLDDVPVRLEVERVEDAPPPVGGDVGLQAGDRP
jgi:hypothetical protein